MDIKSTPELEQKIQAAKPKKKRFYKKRWFWITATVVIILIIISVIMSGREKAPEYTTTEAESGMLIQEVSITGTVKAAEEVDLAFERSGKVFAVNVKVGDVVTEGQILASQASADLSAQLSQAYATLESAKASLNQYEAALASQQTLLDEQKKGTRAEELQVASTAVSNAELSVLNSKSNLTIITSKAVADLTEEYSNVATIIHDALADADYSVNGLTDVMFTGDSSNNPNISFYAKSNTDENIAEAGRVLANTSLDNIKNLESEASATSNQNLLDNYLASTKTELNTIKNFLISLSGVINQAVGLSASTLSTYQSNINTAQSNINTAISSINSKIQTIALQKITNDTNINTAQTTLTTAQNTLNTAKDNLALKQAGFTPEQLSAQQSNVDQAQANVNSQKAQIKYAGANVNNYQALLGKTVVKSPIEGLVTSVDIKKGEIISANAMAFKVISAAKFQIEANVPEVDIANIKLGDESSVTLDAYTSDFEFMSKVVEIDPAETMIDNVPTYKVTFEFNEESDLIKSGMTANLDILTAEKDNVVSVPQRAILKQNSDKIVRILNEKGDDYQEQKVKTGLRGSDGNIEIIEGVKAGDTIILSIKNDD